MTIRRPLVIVAGGIQELPAGDTLPVDSARIPILTSKSGAYIWGSQGVSTSPSLGNGSLRVAPVWFNTPVGITAAGIDFSAAGDAPSLFKIGIFNDDGTGYPGTLAQDCGSISTGTGNAGTVATAGTPGVYLNTLGSTLSLPSGLYWVGGAVQGVTTTQPTIRTSQWMPFNGASSAIPAAASQAIGYTSGGVTSTLPGSFATFGTGIAGSVPRIILRLA